jgi:hypothetical protein
MKKRVVLAAVVVGVGAAAFVITHRVPPVWCQPDGRCAPTGTFAPGDYPIEFRSDCPKGHTMIQYGWRDYIRDPDQTPSRAFDVSYDADTRLPTDSENSDWSSGGRQLGIAFADG